MADSLNKYSNEAAYSAASHGNKVPEVSKVVGSENPVRFDGRNTDTTGSPSVGDAVYLDPDDNVRFISWKNLVPSALGTGWYPVGVVINRFGRKVRIRYKNSTGFTGFISCKANKITSQTSNSISFTVPIDATSAVTLSDNFVPTKSLSSDPQGFIYELDIWLRAHQPDEGGRGGAKLSWHAEYINNTPYIISDSYVADKEISASGLTLESWSHVYPQVTKYSSTHEENCGRMEGSYSVLCLDYTLKTQAQTRTPTAHVSPTDGGQFISKTAFDTSDYCTELRTTYGTYEKYLWSRSPKWPTKKSPNADWHGIARAASVEMGSHTISTLSGTLAPYYRSIDWALHPDTGIKASLVNTIFEWYYPGFIEYAEYYYPRIYSLTDDKVFHTLVQIGTNQTTLNTHFGLQIINCFRSVNVPWLAGSCFTYWGKTSDLFHMGHTCLSFADYDLTGGT